MEEADVQKQQQKRSAKAEDSHNQKLLESEVKKVLKQVQTVMPQTAPFYNPLRE